MGSRSWKFVSLAILIGILAIAGYVLFEFIDVLLLSLAIAYIAAPLAKKMYGKPVKKDMKYLIASVFAVTIVSIPFILATFYGLNYLLRWFIENLPAIQSGAFANTLKFSLKEVGFGVLSERIASELSKVVVGLSASLGEFIVRPTWLLDLILRIALFFITSFYFIYEGPNIKKFINKNIPKKERFLQELMDAFDHICYGLFVGHFLTSIIIAIFFGAIYWAIFQPAIFSLLTLILMMFVISFLPVIGPWSLYIPLALWHLFILPTGIIRVMIFFALCMVFLTIAPDLYIRPMLVKRESDIHPLLIIFGFFGGPIVFGIKGVIIGPLMLGLAHALLRLYVEKRHVLKELIEHF
jgi:predicted PurR-regulated permease PerM